LKPKIAAFSVALDGPRECGSQIKKDIDFARLWLSRFGRTKEHGGGKEKEKWEMGSYRYLNVWVNPLITNEAPLATSIFGTRGVAGGEGGVCSLTPLQEHCSKLRDL